MLTHPTHDRLVALGLTGMAKALEEQRNQPDIAALSFEERLALMVDREAIERENKRLVSRLKFASLRQSAVVEDQQFDPRQALEEPGMTPVAACQGQGIEQPWHSLIEDGTIVAARLMAERTGKPTFARTGRAADQQALVPCDPVAGDELGE